MKKALDVQRKVAQGFKDALREAYRPHVEQNRAYGIALEAAEAENLRLRADIKQAKAEAWAEGNLAAYPLQLAVGQFIDNGGDTWGHLDDAYEQVSAAPNPYQKEDGE